MEMKCPRPLVFSISIILARLYGSPHSCLGLSAQSVLDFSFGAVAGMASPVTTLGAVLLIPVQIICPMSEVQSMRKVDNSKYYVH